MKTAGLTITVALLGLVTVGAQAPASAPKPSGQKPATAKPC